MVEDLVADDACHFEALLAGDRVDNHIAVDADEVLRVKNAVLILQGGQIVSGLAPSKSQSATARRKHSPARSTNKACMARGGVG